MSVLIEMTVYFLLPLGLIAVVVALLNAYVQTNPAKLMLLLRRVVGGIGLAFAFFRHSNPHTCPNFATLLAIHPARWWMAS